MNTTTMIDSADYVEVPPGHPSMRHKLGNPWAYFKKCLALYADGKGRAGVAEYWSFALFQILVVLPFVAVMVADPGLRNGTDPGILFVLGMLGIVVVSLGLLVPAVCVTVRRLHDIGLSGWLYLLGFVPYVGGLFLFVCSLIPSSEKTNKHGPSPKTDVSDAFA